MTPFRENLRGIVSISACNLVFLINDTMIKLANSELPLGEILFLRGIISSILLVPIVLLTGAHRHIHLLFNRGMFWRILAEIVAAFLFLLALFQMPIANVNAILQVVPLMVTASAAIFFGERVGWRRWVAITVGFIGVLVVIRPGLAGFDVYSLLALAAMGFITLRDLTTRIIPPGLPALLVAFATAFSVGLSGPGIGLILEEEWLPPSARSLGLIAGATVFLIGGYLTAVDFMRHGDISVVAPFRYSVILWAIIVGFIVWGEIPDTLMLVGTAIIIATGVYTFYRERRLAIAAAEPVDI